MKFTANLLVTSPPDCSSGDVRSRRFPPIRLRRRPEFLHLHKGPTRGPLFSATRLGGRRRISYFGGSAASREQFCLNILGDAAWTGASCTANELWQQSPLIIL